MFRPSRFLIAAAILALTTPARSSILDQGSFKLYRHDRALGAETFELGELQDSLIVHTHQFLTIPTAEGEETVERAADLLVRRSDFSLRDFQSTRTFRGVMTRRGLALADTHYVAYREDEHGGDGESRVLPPGRLYVMDSQIITLFDLVCRSFHARSFESKPIHLLALGPRDTLLEARVIVLPDEVIRWGARPVRTRKIQIVADARTTFTLWVGPQGQLLRLIEPAGGLRAERDAPDVRRRAPSPPKPGG